MLLCVALAGVFKTILYVLLSLLALMFMIVVHEFGHFIAGRKLGFQVNEFSIGFGPAIFKKRMKDGLLFSVRCLPLGGYCAFEGEDEEGAKDNPKAFNNRKPWQRIIVLLAGATMNFLCAVVFISIFFMTYGQPMTTIRAVYSDSTSVSSEFGFMEGDAILNVNGKMANVLTMGDSAFNYVSKDETGEVTFTVIRNGEIVKVKVPKGNYMTYQTNLSENVFARTEKGMELVLRPGDLLYEVGGKLGYCYSPDMVNAYLQNAKNGDSLTFYRYVTTDGEIIENTKNLPKEYLVNFVYVHFADELPEEQISSERFDKDGYIDTHVYLKSAADLYYTQGDVSMTSPISSISDCATTVSDTSYGFGVATSVGYEKLSFTRSIGRAVPYSFYTVFKILTSIVELFKPHGIENAGGTITIISTMAKAVSNGFGSFFWLVCIISANLAVMNLLPIPALDGSKVVFTVIEWIRGKPINRKVEAVIHMVGLVLLFGLAIGLDIFHLVA